MKIQVGISVGKIKSLLNGEDDECGPGIKISDETIIESMESSLEETPECFLRTIVIKFNLPVTRSGFHSVLFGERIEK